MNTEQNKETVTQLENGTDTCNCVKVKCERHGKCAECMAHHEQHKKHPPYCKRKSRIKKAEK